MVLSSDHPQELLYRSHEPVLVPEPSTGPPRDAVQRRLPHGDRPAHRHRRAAPLRRVLRDRRLPHRRGPTGRPRIAPAPADEGPARAADRVSPVPRREPARRVESVTEPGPRRGAPRHAVAGPPWPIVAATDRPRGRGDGQPSSPRRPDDGAAPRASDRPGGPSRTTASGSRHATSARSSPRTPTAGQRLCAEAAGLYLDYSKNRVTDETVRLLLDLAAESGVAERRDAMFRGEHVNVSEDRAVLHVALRMPRAASLVVDGVDVVAEVHAVLDQMTAFADRVRSGEWRGHTGRADRQRRQHRDRRLGPRAGDGLRGAALLQPPRDLTFRFVSNVDSTDLVEAVRDLDAAETLFIVSSKTFGDPRDAHQRHSARAWLIERLGDESADRQALRRGVDERAEGRGLRHRHRQHVRVLGLGRRPLLDGLGDRPVDDARDRPGEFAELLAGFHDMDEHFRTAPLAENLPVLMGLLAVWNRDFLGLPHGRRDALRPVPEATAGVPPAAHDGVQRQARHARRRGGRLPDRRGLLGRARAPTASTASTS